MRAVALVALVAVGCGGEKRGERDEICAGHVVRLRNLGVFPPAGFPVEAVMRLDGPLPAVTGSRPIPPAHEANAELYEVPTDPTGAAYYVRTAPDNLASVLLDDVSARHELRLVVAKSNADLVAQHLRVMPRTPAALRGELPRMTSLDVAAEPLLLLGASPTCDVRSAFAVLTEDGDVGAWGAALGDELERCRCDLPQLEGFASLVFWLALPYPRHGYVVVDPEVVTALGPDATVQQAAEALAR